jgi:hypothetical protein
MNLLERLHPDGSGATFSFSSCESSVEPEKRAATGGADND